MTNKLTIARKNTLKKFVHNNDIPIIDYTLINKAFTHPTYVFEHAKENLENNQRLEFLGDAVLGMVIAELLYQQYPNKAEGELTKMRAVLVCEPALAELAIELEIGSYLLLGRGEESSGGRQRVSTLADALEAVIGAIFIDSGLRKTKDLIYKLFIPKIAAVKEGNYGDYKTNLQELVQEKGEENVSYTIVKESGPDHNKTFVVGIVYHEQIVATGEGKSKKEAEQRAAQKALVDCNWLGDGVTNG